MDTGTYRLSWFLWSVATAVGLFLAFYGGHKLDGNPSGGDIAAGCLILAMGWAVCALMGRELHYLLEIRRERKRTNRS